MPKARRSTRNSDAMDAEGHEEVRRVFFVFASSSCTFCCLCVCLSFSFDDDVRVFLNPPISPIGEIQFFQLCAFCFYYHCGFCVLFVLTGNGVLCVCVFLSFFVSLDRSKQLEAMTAEDDEILKMKEKLAEMEREASSLREQEQGIDGKALDEEMAKHPENAGGSGKPQKTPEDLEKEKAERQEIDSRSVFVGQVDYGAEPGMLAEHFKKCGTVNRVTILTDKFENPKGFAYVEFLEKDAVDAAVLLDGTSLEEFPHRKLKVSAKRTNVPGMKAGGRGRGRGRFGAFGGMMMVPMMMPYGRGRGRGRGGRGGGRGRGGGAPGSSPY
jgi:polyadenylate-binding protein 2